MATENKSPHILNVSANLFGLCFVVFSYLEVNKIRAHTYLDELTALSMTMFMISTMASFLSIRSQSKAGYFYEKLADYVFLSGMLILFMTIVLLMVRVLI